jgi:hypothetical protein
MQPGPEDIVMPPAGRDVYRMLGFIAALVLLAGVAVAIERSSRSGRVASVSAGAALSGGLSASAPSSGATSVSDSSSSDVQTTTTAVFATPTAPQSVADRCQGRGTDDGAGGCNWYETTITGRVTDDTGSGVGGICVEPSPTANVGTTITTSDGSYRVVADHALAGRADVNFRDCSGADPGWVDRTHVSFDLVPGTTNRLDVVVGRAATVTGHVVDVNGAPVSGACVRTVAANDQFSGTVRTDDAGRFRITHILTGDNRAEAQQDCPVPYMSSETQFNAAPGGTADVTITVTRPGQQPTS